MRSLTCNHLQRGQKDTFTLGRACDELVIPSSCRKTVMVFSQCEEVITLNNVSLEFIPILRKVRRGKTDKSGVFCLSADLNTSGICASLGGGGGGGHHFY